MHEIILQAILYKLSSTIDGGWRLTFDVSQSDVEEIKKLASARDQLFQMALVEMDESGPVS